MIRCLLLALLIPAALSAQSAEEKFNGPVQVYLTPDKARSKMFPDATFFAFDRRPISAGLKEALRQQLGRPVREDTLAVGRAFKDDQLLGYAIIAEEIGKYRPITYIVGIDPSFEVEAAAILVYRESRGGEVRRARFLRQYVGKSADDPIRINRDIINITGATMSVRSLNFGIKKMLHLSRALYGETEAGPGS